MNPDLTSEADGAAAANDGFETKNLRLLNG
jgi:hypothetical protein